MQSHDHVLLAVFAGQLLLQKASCVGPDAGMRLADVQWLVGTLGGPAAPAAAHDTPSDG